MTLKRLALSALIFILFVKLANSQELNCRVAVNYSKLRTTNTQIFQSLQRDIQQFMNNTRWTNYVFAPEERIDCNILIILSSFDGTDYFKGTIQVSSNRPVYNSSYMTPILNFKERDGWLEFRYVENQPIEFNDKTFTGDLAYTLAFYAYLIIGLDFDTFQKDGGKEFFQKLNVIVSNAQSSPAMVWKAMGTNRYDNRYYIAKDLNDPALHTFHSAMYKYHRLGLDYMADDIDKGRQGVLEALKDLERFYRIRPQSYLLRMFLEAKRQEIINIFSEAPMQEATQAANILKRIDPANANKYNNLGRR